MAERVALGNKIVGLREFAERSAFVGRMLISEGTLE